MPDNAGTEDNKHAEGVSLNDSLRIGCLFILLVTCYIK